MLFWFLSLYDLYVPVDVYETEIEKLHEITSQPIEERGEDNDEVIRIIRFFTVLLTGCFPYF